MLCDFGAWCESLTLLTRKLDGFAVSTVTVSAQHADRKGNYPMTNGIVRIGIIGAGFARTTQIPGFKNCKDAQIVAIASARREHAEKVARESGIPHVESDWHALVAREDVDLVSI